MKGKRNMKGTFKTLKTFKKLEEPELYVMDYVADYNLDKLLAMGSGSDEEFAKNVCKILLNGLPVAVKPEGGCSTSPEYRTFKGGNYHEDQFQAHYRRHDSDGHGPYGQHREHLRRGGGS